MPAFHPFADIFPLITGADFEALVDDIREHGLREPVILFDKQILDGRNRFRAMERLIETGEVLGDGWGHRKGECLTASALEAPQLWFKAYNRALDGDPLAWVISKNLKRRHLDESQRAMVAAKLANMRVGRPTKETTSIEGVSTGAAAKLLNVGRASVERARVVQSRGAPELAEAVEQGKVAVSTAETIARAAPAEQAQILETAAGDEKKILAAAKEIRSRQRKERFEQVTEKLASISEESRPLPTGQKYPVIYADPATRYVSGFGDRSIENHYPTMTIDELCALPVSDLALPDAVLFVWTTIPQLRNTMRFIEAWGFNYVSAWCWDKVDHGTGHWGFNQHEELLIATRGNFPAPVPGTQPRSLYREKKTEHSRKPEWFAQQIERIYPSLPKIELFARRARPGWAVWGNQAGHDGDDADDASRETCAFGERERVIWKALGAIEANVTIQGPLLGELLAERLIMTGAVDCGYILTSRGQSTLGMYDAHFNPIPEPADGADPDHVAAGGVLIPSMAAKQSGEFEAGETTTASARAASSPALRAPADPDAVEGGCGHTPAQSQANADADIAATGVDGAASRLTGGRTPDSAAGSAVADPAAPDPLDIPAFLKRGPNNAWPATSVEPA